MYYASRHALRVTFICRHSLYARGVMRGSMRGVMGMRDECLHLCVINFSALRCPRDLTNLKYIYIIFFEMSFHINFI